MENISFNDYGLCKEILKSIDLMNFSKPTEIQKKSIPVILEKDNVIIKSQTGSGKTAAFGIPICQMIDWEEFSPQALVIVPTRELALQVKEDLFNIGRFKILKVVSVFGKMPITRQEGELKQKAHIVVGTPGRIIDLINRGSLDVSNIKYLVIDEADEILNMGFIDQIETIISELPRKRKNILLSATMPEKIRVLATKYIKNPIEITSEEETKVKDMIEQEVYRVSESDKMSLLKDITVVENPDSCIVFCNTQQKVDDIYNELIDNNYTCEKIHGGLDQNDRLIVMSDFKKGAFRYLIATDVASRGIDIESVSLIINFDIPKDKESYVHRIGRTGRIGKKGKAVSFVTQYEYRYVSDIEKIIGMKLEEKIRPSRESISASRKEFNEKMILATKVKLSKGHNLNKEILKLHINAGRKTKMRAIDIVGTICGIEGMSKEDIGIIEIRDISTFVEIVNNKGEFVYEKLQTTPIKGRLRRVSKTEE